MSNTMTVSSNTSTDQQQMAAMIADLVEEKFGENDDNDRRLRAELDEFMAAGLKNQQMH